MATSRRMARAGLSPWGRLPVWLVLGGLFILVSCTEDLPSNPVPRLEVVGVNRAEIRSADIPGVANEVVFTLRFADGDGDIGGDTLVPTLEVVDTRPGYPYFLVGGTRVDSIVNSVEISQPINGDPGPIEGTIRLTVRNTTFVPSRNANPPPLPEPTEQTVQFRVRLIDLAGNVSNAVLTPPVQVVD